MTNHLYRIENAGGENSAAGFILQGAKDRLVPMLVSGLATALALLPTLFLGDIPGLETIRPMAIVVLGGVITTLLLDLYVLPVFFLRYGLSREADLELAPAPAAAD